MSNRLARPDMNLRNELAKQASTLCENARTSIRAARHQGQKDIKKDENAKTVSGEEATREMKKVSSSLLSCCTCKVDRNSWRTSPKRIRLQWMAY